MEEFKQEYYKNRVIAVCCNCLSQGEIKKMIYLEDGTFIHPLCFGLHSFELQQHGLSPVKVGVLKKSYDFNSLDLIAAMHRGSNGA